MLFRTRVVCTLCLFTLAILPGAANAEESSLWFNRDIRPILSSNCFACHGFDAKKRQADLRLDTPEGATADHDGVQAIAPGNLAKSELWRRVTNTDEDEMMPPPASNKKLTDAERRLLKKWI
ncbi:MAG TPA: c-type cytochrome domain-containing protein [Pirellulaceae bacterium]|nr:c-type cytochrome domain-containing protein [Pirellulaceae bacterium]